MCLCVYESECVCALPHRAHRSDERECMCVYVSMGESVCVCVCEREGVCVYRLRGSVHV